MHRGGRPAEADYHGGIGLGIRTYTASFTGVTAGSAATVSAMIDGVPITSPPASITVVPGEISPETSSLSVSRTDVDSGARSVVTMRARDAAGNNLVSGGRIVSFELTDGSGHGVIGSTTDHGDGTYRAVYIGQTVDPDVPDTITARIGGTPLETAPVTVAVVAGTISPDQSTVEVSASQVQAGQSIVVTLVGRDAAGRGLVTGDRSLALEFTLVGGTSTGTFGPVQNPDNGSYSVEFVGEQAGTAASIGVTIDGLPVTTPAPEVTVVPGPAPPGTADGLSTP